MNSGTKKLVTASMLTAICCISTMVIKIPSPLKGYINLGDCAVLISGFLLPPFYGFFAAGIGSALADILSGYIVYAPATFVIKGLMAIITYFVFNFMQKRVGLTPARIIGSTVAEIMMVIGYFVFEGFMYGFIPSVVNIPANSVQGIAGIILGVLLANIFDNNKKL